MKECFGCRKTEEEIELFEGISPYGIVNICRECSEAEKIPIVRKPSKDQLSAADKRYTVRERMERLSGRHETTDISGDQVVVQRNLAKLKAPAPKQHNDEVEDNYYWNLSLARRRKKLTIGQLSRMTGIQRETIQHIEQGKIPENFREIFQTLENTLGTKLLKSHEAKPRFVGLNKDEEIIEEVRRKMNSKSDEDSEEDAERREKIREQLEGIEEGKLDFSRRGDLQNVTLKDLVDRKRKLERKEEERKVRRQNESMMGEDLDLDF